MTSASPLSFLDCPSEPQPRKSSPPWNLMLEPQHPNNRAFPNDKTQKGRWKAASNSFLVPEFFPSNPKKNWSCCWSFSTKKRGKTHQKTPQKRLIWPSPSQAQHESPSCKAMWSEIPKEQVVVGTSPVSRRDFSIGKSVDLYISDISPVPRKKKKRPWKKLSFCSFFAAQPILQAPHRRRLTCALCPSRCPPRPWHWPSPKRRAWRYTGLSLQ